MGNAKVSVITICYNAATTLSDTIKSVLTQSYKDVEYILIDGGSTDGTPEVIDKFRPHIDLLVSEKDKGIYDAMNKGVSIATGDFLMFLNAGDAFATSNSIEKLIASREKGEIIYGSHYVRYPDSKKMRFVRAKDPECLWMGMICSHQSMLFSRELFRRDSFETNESIISDFRFIWRCQQNGVKFARVDDPICIYEAGGVSDVRRITSIWRRWQTIRKYVPWWLSTAHYFPVFLEAATRELVRALLPRGLFLYFRDKKNAAT